MHTIKIKSTDIHGVCGEAGREVKSKVGEPKEDLSYLNYNLAPINNRKQTAEELREYIREKFGITKIRKDAVLGLSTIITMPADFPKEYSEAFFQAAYQALTEEFCQGKEDRVLQAYVHLDEKTPHMHFVSIPIIEKEGELRLSAKDLLNRNFLKRLHPDIEKKMSNFLNYEVKLYNEELCKEREDKRKKGDHSLDCVGLEQYKGLKEYEGKIETYKHKIIMSDKQLQTQRNIINKHEETITGKHKEIEELEHKIENLSNETKKTKKAHDDTIKEIKTNPAFKIPNLILKIVDRIRKLEKIFKKIDEYEQNKIITPEEIEYMKNTKQELEKAVNILEQEDEYER